MNTKTKFKNFTLKTLLIAATIGVSAGFSSCKGDDDDDQPSGQGSNYKITVTLNGVDSNDDYVAITAAGGNSGATTTIWELNGVEQTAQQGVSVTDTDFEGATKTYVFETVTPILAVSTGGQVINYGAPITGSFIIEKNGNVEVTETINLTGDGSDWTKNFQFSN